VRGKYHERATAGTTLVLLERDVAAPFPDGRSVNLALRTLIKVADTNVGSLRVRTKLPDSASLPPTHPRKVRAKSKERVRAARG
jgi:hypothetical protein